MIGFDDIAVESALFTYSIFDKIGASRQGFRDGNKEGWL